MKKKVIADLHVHSKYSRATSKRMEPKTIAKWASIKGIDIVGTGDALCPPYLEELEKALDFEGPGLYRLKGENSPFFMLTTEVSNIFLHKGEIKRVHTVITFKDLDSVKKLKKYLEKRGVNLLSDGRPTLNIHIRELFKIVSDLCPSSLLIPAHIWTPWYSIFGSRSGFDTLYEALSDMINYVAALETGLSSDPKMNWMVSALDRFSLVSNSDAHSPEHLGREANVFLLEEFSYDEICEIIRNKDKKRFLFTIEFYPEEGKYHFDGHRNCNISIPPKEAENLQNICPVCRKPLTKGVLHRVFDLSDREFGFVPEDAIPAKHLIPLSEIIASVLNAGSLTKKVSGMYMDMIKKGGSEFSILLDIDFSELKNLFGQDIAKAIKKVREGKVHIKPGYDGVYGKIEIPKDKKKTLFG